VKRFAPFFAALSLCGALTGCAAPMHAEYALSLPNFDKTAWTITYPDQAVRPGVFAMLTNSDTGTQILVLRETAPDATSSATAAKIRALLQRRGVVVDRFIEHVGATTDFSISSAPGDKLPFKGVVVIEPREGAEGLFILMATWPEENEPRAREDFAWVAHELSVTKKLVPDE
jgi:hypothetical protein